MSDGVSVKDSLVNLISKIGEKISIRRAKFFNNSSGLNFFMCILLLRKISER